MLVNILISRVFFFFRLLYDEQGHLVALETKDQKLYVAADHVGSPLLIFRPDGTVDKAVKYLAYGRPCVIRFKSNYDLACGLSRWSQHWVWPCYDRPKSLRCFDSPMA